MVLLKKDVCRLTRTGLQCSILILALQCAILIFALVFSVNTVASGLNAPFTGSRINGLTRNSTVFEYDSTVDNSGNLVDISGSNYLTYSEAFSSWTATRSSVTVDAYRNPVNNDKTADALIEDGTAGNSHFVYNTYSTTTGLTYTFSVYVKQSYRTWVYLKINTDAASAYFNLSTGAAGTTASNTTTTITRVKDQWYRCAITWKSSTTGSQQFEIYAAEADADITFDGSLGREDLILFGAQVNKVDEWRSKVSIYHPTTSVNKPAHDMASTGSPTSSLTTLQDSSGRMLRARTFDGSSQYYSAAHHDSFNIFDTDFTLINVSCPTSQSPQIANRLLGRSGAGGGLTIAPQSSDTNLYAVLYKTTGGVGSINVVSNGIYYYNYCHVVQLVRRSNIATLGVDGSFGTPVNVTGYGEDLNATSLYIGRDASGSYFKGSIVYTRVDAEALSDIQLAREREILQGTLMSSGKLYPGSTFSRTSLASVKNSRGNIDYFAVGTPRISGDGGGVRIEEARTNLALQSQTLDNASWTQVALTSITANGTQSPDTTVTAEGFIGTAVDTLHGITQGVTLTAAQYDISVFAKPGNKNWIYLSDDTVANATMYCNVSMCVVGTMGAGGASSRAEPYADGWCRCSFRVLGTAASHTIKIASANADTDNDFAGDATTVNTWFWGTQVELGYHPTSYIATTSSTVTRSADNLTIEPWRVSKNTVVNDPTFAMYFDNDVCNTTPCYTYASEVGNYSFTVYGDTKHVESQTQNDYFSFDGTGDYLALPHGSSTDLYPTNDFSIVAIVTTSSVAAGNRSIFSNYGGGSTGFELFQTGSNSIALFAGDGSGGTQATKASSIYANTPIFITASFQKGAGATNSIANIYVDALAVATNAAMRYPTGAANGFAIGAIPTISEYWNGKIHYLAYYKGTAITQAQHDTMYANFREANILPTKIGNSYEHKKLYVNFDAKCMYTGSSDVSPNTVIPFIGISGNTGTADSDTNNVVFYSYNNSVRASVYADGENTERFMSLTTSTLNVWHTYKFYLDFSALQNSTGYQDSSAFTLDATLTGAKNFDLTNTRIRIEQRYDTSTIGSCFIRNLKMYSAQ